VFCKYKSAAQQLMLNVQVPVTKYNQIKMPEETPGIYNDVVKN